MLRLLPLLTLLFPLLAQAQPVMMKLITGTGFYINRDGDVVTNAHVVRECKSITVQTPLGERKAVIKARDEARDLAVLWVAGAVSEIAPMRWNIRDLKPGDDVVVMGYPGERGMTNDYLFRKTTLVGLKGPTGEPNWLQLGSVAEKGNSGGPLLDSTGNVIAVVTGKAMTYRVDTSGNAQANPPKLIGETTVAITLNALQEFLRANAISFYEAPSGLVAHADAVLEQKARQFIVPVRCLLGPVS